MSRLARFGLPAFILALGVLWAAAPSSSEGQLFGRPAPASKASIEVLDIGQGDAILVRSPDGKAALVDAGPSSEIVDLLRKRGVTSIDLLVLTHHHLDHYGGMSAVIRAFHPRYLVTCESQRPSPQYARFLQVVKDAKLTVVRPTAKPRRIELGQVAMTLLPQPPYDDKSENDNSVGVRVDYGRLSFLMTGDSEDHQRRWWMEHCPDLVRNCTVFKLAHHGSRNGIDSAWLAMVHPQQAVVSLATGNSFGHPHKETLDLLKRANVPLLQTNLVGTITVTSDGRDWDVTTARSSNRGPPARQAQATASTKPRSDPEPDPDPVDRSTRSARPTRIDLNSADAQELQQLPGVGPILAKRIIAARPYQSAEDLRKVNGIGDARFRQLRPLVSPR